MNIVKRKTSIGWSDPRTEIGELMCPERRGRQALDDLKRGMTPYAVSGQLQQLPSPPEGGIFQRNAWRFYDVEPVYFDDLCSTWDLSFKGLNDSDEVAGLVIGRLGPNFYILPKRVYARLGFTASVKAVVDLSAQYPRIRAKYIEDKANGPAVIEVLSQQIAGVIAVNPEGGKTARANAISYLVSAGNVYLPNPKIWPWVSEFVEHAAAFPNSKADHDIDAFTQGLLKMSRDMQSQFFGEFRARGPHHQESEDANHVAPVGELKHWQHRWISAEWTPEQSWVHWYCQGDPKVLVYREWSGRCSAEELGAKIAELSRTELAAASNLTVWVNPDAVEPSAGKSIAQRIQVGIERTMSEPVFLFAHTVDETTMPDAAQRMASLEARRKKANARLSVRGAAIEGGASGVWEHARALMRWWPLHEAKTIPFDRATALALRAEEDGERKYQAYMRMVNGEAPEKLPLLQIDPSCEIMIGAIQGLTIDPNKQVVPLDVNGAARSFLWGMTAHSGKQNRKSWDEFLAQHIDRVVEKHPQADAGALYLAEQTAAAMYKIRSPQKMYRMPRTGIRHASRRIA